MKQDSKVRYCDSLVCSKLPCSLMRQQQVLHLGRQQRHNPAPFSTKIPGRLLRRSKTLGAIARSCARCKHAPTLTGCPAGGSSVRSSGLSKPSSTSMYWFSARVCSTSSSVPAHLFHRGMDMWVLMLGLMSNRADTTCIRTSSFCTGPYINTDSIGFLLIM